MKSKSNIQIAVENSILGTHKAALLPAEGRHTYVGDGHGSIYDTAGRWSSARIYATVPSTRRSWGAL